MILFIDACARRESRTRALSEYLLSRLEGEVQTVRLYEEDLPTMDEAHLAARDEALAKGDFSAPDFRFARQLAGADTVVVAAPFWDQSFPAVLKKYLEDVAVTGITFRYSDKGIPQSLCRLRELYYVTTAGGPILSADFSYGYVRELMKGYFGVENTHFFSAQGLDIWGSDEKAILAAAREEIDRHFKERTF